MNPVNLMVSICCTTYNHQPYIIQTVESFLMQKTSFDFEIIIGDDCSTDGTSEILRDYAERYPGKVKIITPDKNVGPHQNMRSAVKHCKGKYIALCDGDDYWINPLKLQKQVDLLEANPQYIICCHHTRVVDAGGKTLYVNPTPEPLIHTYHDLLTGKQEETKTATVVYRNSWVTNQVFEEQWYSKCYAGDKLFKLYATFHTGLAIYVMPDVMSCYRNHVGGVWSMIAAAKRMEMVISDFNLIIKQFSYKGIYRFKLVLLYLNRYAFFELRRGRYRKVYNTIKYLLEPAAATSVLKFNRV